MGDETFEVDVDALLGIGKKVAEAATTLRAAVSAAGTSLAPAPHPSSAAATAAQAAEQRWLTDLKLLTGEVDQYGKGLTSSAQHYRATDQDSSDRLKRTGAGR